MEMAAPLQNVVGQGQPGRHDLHSRDHLQRLNPGTGLQIPNGTVSQPKNRRGTEAEVRRFRWADMERAVQQGAGFDNGNVRRWSDFNGSRSGRTLGTVTVDQPPPPQTEAETDGPKTWETSAAEFEEFWRGPDGERYGVGGDPEVSETTMSGTSSGERPARNQRRAFQLVA